MKKREKAMKKAGLRTAKRAVCVLLMTAMLCTDSGLTVFATEAGAEHENLTGGVLSGETPSEGNMAEEGSPEEKRSEGSPSEGDLPEENPSEENPSEGDLPEENPSEEDPSEEIPPTDGTEAEKPGGENMESPEETDSGTGEDDASPKPEETENTAEEETVSENTAETEDPENMAEDVAENSAKAGLLVETEIEIDGVYQFGDAPSDEGGEGSIQLFSIDGIDTIQETGSASIEDYICQELLKRTEEINISDYGILKDAIGQIFSGVLNEHPELYYVSKSIRYSSVQGSGVVIALQPSYDNDFDDAAFRRETEAALSCVKDGMSDLQKAVVLHDYLAVNCKYDYGNYLAGSLPGTVYSAYGVLVNGTAVCEGYALAYKYLLNKSGINCCMVTSDSMDHAWNLIELDGKYYHTDVTWDDPTWDLTGRARHAYMLCSDADFAAADDQKEAHSGWCVTSGSSVVDYVADDTRYDGAFWKTVDAPLVLAGENWNDCYYVHNTCEIHKTVFSDITSEGTSIADFGRWTVWGNEQSAWKGAYSGLFLYNGRLHYNDKSSIYSIALDGSDS